MRVTGLLLFAFLASCQGPSASRPKLGEVALRTAIGVSLTNLEATTEVPFFGQLIQVTEKGEAIEPMGRLEVCTPLTRDGTDIGGYLSFGHADFDSSESAVADSLSIGAILRQYLNHEDRIRPYAEVRAGFRQTWIGEFFGTGYDLGLGLGVEFSTGRRTAVFVQMGYDRGSTDANDVDTQFDGFNILIGGSVRL